MARGSGWIEVITGAMFSGKTEELIRRVRRAQIAKQVVVVFKPKRDTRYDPERLTTHNGIKLDSLLINVEHEGMEKLVEIAKQRSAEVVAIDEANFFPERLVEVCELLADQRRRVIVAGLDLDFRGEPFSPIPQLMARAERVDKLQAVCMRCGGPGTRTQRLVNGRPARYNDPLIVVGGADKYEARCRACYEPAV